MDEGIVPAWMSRFPPADITPEEFEGFVVEILEAVQPRPENYEVKRLETIEGTDGTYTFDATVRFDVAGMRYLTVVEAKRHANPVKRDLVQVLHSKMLAVGAQKAILISTAKYQLGAMNFAQTHGIALVSITEGRFLYETRTATQRPAPSRQEASERFGLPTYVGHSFGAGDTPGSVRVTTVSTRDPEYIRELLPGIVESKSS